jgi:hypothetical protein
MSTLREIYRVDQLPQFQDRLFRGDALRDHD